MDDIEAGAKLAAKGLEEGAYKVAEGGELIAEWIEENYCQIGVNLALGTLFGALLYRPEPSSQGKGYDTWLDVTSYQIHQDGTFVLTFPKPPTALEVEQRRKSALEKSEAPTWNFGNSRSTNRRRITPVD